MEYLTRDEFRGRAQPTSNNEGVNESLVDDSLLVSPVLADYIGGTSSANRETSKDDLGKDCPTGSDKLTSPERINLGADMQLDASCISLGLGSIESVETSLQKDNTIGSICEYDEIDDTEECQGVRLSSPTSSKTLLENMSSKIGENVSPIPSKKHIASKAQAEPVHDVKEQVFSSSKASIAQCCDETDKLPTSIHTENDNDSLVSVTEVDASREDKEEHLDEHQSIRSSVYSLEKDVEIEKECNRENTEFYAGVDFDVTTVTSVEISRVSKGKDRSCDRSIIEKSLISRDGALMGSSTKGECDTSSENIATTITNSNENEEVEDGESVTSTALGKSCNESAVSECDVTGEVLTSEIDQLSSPTPLRPSTSEIVSKIGGGNVSPIPNRNSSSPNVSAVQHQQDLSSPKASTRKCSNAATTPRTPMSIRTEHNCASVEDTSEANLSGERKEENLNVVQHDLQSTDVQDLGNEDSALHTVADNSLTSTTVLPVSKVSLSLEEEKEKNKSSYSKLYTDKDDSMLSSSTKDECDRSAEKNESILVESSENGSKENSEPTTSTKLEKNIKESVGNELDDAEGISNCDIYQLSSPTPLRASSIEIVSKIGSEVLSPILNRNSSSPNMSTVQHHPMNCMENLELPGSRASIGQCCDEVNTSRTPLSNHTENNCISAADKTKTDGSNEVKEKQSDENRCTKLSTHSVVNCEQESITEENECTVVDSQATASRAVRFSMLSSSKDQLCDESEVSTDNGVEKNSMSPIFTRLGEHNEGSLESESNEIDVNVEFNSHNNTTISDISVLGYSIRETEQCHISPKPVNTERVDRSSNSLDSALSPGFAAHNKSPAICSTSLLENESLKSPRNKSVDAVCTDVDFSTETRSPVGDIDNIYDDLCVLSDREILASPQSNAETQTYRDLSSAKKKLGATSSAMMERLREAAQQRKLEVARSRDSFAAREQKQLMMIQQISTPLSPKLESGRKEYSRPQPVRATSSKTKINGANPYKPFRARQLPASTGETGNGGQVGVPRVSKKPATTPVSPKLGHRRGYEKSLKTTTVKKTSPKDTKQMKERRQNVTDSKKPTSTTKPGSEYVDVSKKTQHQESSYAPFKALPLPATNAQECHGGQVGVPKVTKRPVTIPISPPLGAKRHNTNKQNITRDSRNALTCRKSGFERQLGKQPSKINKETKLSLSNVRYEPIARETEASQAKDRAIQDKIKQLEAEAKMLAAARAELLPTPTYETPAANVGSPGLLGLDLLNKRSRRRSSNYPGKENNPATADLPFEESPKKKNRASPLILYSTARAKSRAEFESRRSSREKTDRAETRRRRQIMIQEQMAELEELRESLR